VLAQYPLGIVRECCDPRYGLARAREFPPTVACIVEWCDRRLEFHRNWAAYRPFQRRAINKPDPIVKHGAIGEWLQNLAKRLRMMPGKPKPAPRQAPSNDELRAHYAQQQAAAE